MSSCQGHLNPGPLPRDAIRELDRRAIEEFRIPGLVLMENAGEGCVRLIEELVRDGEVRPPFRIVCGFGNNAGDGFVIARHLHNRGHAVEVLLVGERERIRAGSDARINLEAIESMSVPLRDAVADPNPASALSTGTVVDAIFGSGLSRPLEPPQRRWVEAINGSGLPALAIDIPSGLDADTGEVLGAAVRAAHTFTFVAPKLGFERGQGPRHVGRVHVVGISIPRELLEDV